MSIANGTSNISKLYLGSGEVSRAYQGSTLVYGSAPVLPYDAEVEYLQLDGNQYIELPVIPSEVTDAIEITFRRTANTYQQRFFMATPVGTTTSDVFQCYVNGNGRLAYNKNGTWQFVINNNCGAIGIVKHTFRFDYLNKKIYYDGEQFTMGSTARTAEYNLILFGQRGTQATFEGLVYGVKFWRSGTLMYNLQPVRKDGVGYFYDKVGGTMYSNGGSGSFTIGYDKLTSLSSFTQLEYIENTSTAATAPYIDTGIISNAGVIDMGMTVKWNTIDSSLRQLMGNNVSPFWGCDAGEYKTNGTSMGLETPSTSSYDTVTMTQYTDTPSYAQTLGLFKSLQPTDRTQTQTSYICRCKLAAYWIKVDNVLVRDYVPVLHPSNVYGMFDKVENKFYASANSGAFTGA